MTALPYAIGLATAAGGAAAVVASVRRLLPAAPTGRHRTLPARQYEATVPGRCTCVDWDRMTTRTLHADGSSTCRSCGHREVPR
ncbi:hypothetical protein [Streptomyces sulphureus]|uniref:hypothetical protein n=1 Tax=Streptomyces sulphureus TaxID=47758 RepID=UPI00037F3CA2|nr:hypothetical protein [Streptomyces sulphureus]